MSPFAALLIERVTDPGIRYTVYLLYTSNTYACESHVHSRQNDAKHPNQGDSRVVKYVSHLCFLKLDMD